MGKGEPTIFLDSSGRRARRLRLAAALVGLGALALLAVFVFSVVRPPTFPGLKAPATPIHAFAARPTIHSSRLAAARKALLARIDAEHARAPLKTAPATGVRGAYFAPWRDSGLVAFRQHARELTHVYPAWITLTPDGGGIDTSTWTPSRSTSTRALQRIAGRSGVKVIPVVSNAQAGEFDAARLKKMLADPAAAARVADALAAFVKTNGYAGLQVDFELLEPPLAEKLAPWLRALRERIHAGGGELSVTLEAELSDAGVRALGDNADYAVLMAYDEHEMGSGAGPLASADWVQRAVERFAGLLGPERVVLGIGAYGYDWNLKTGITDALSNAQVMALAARFRGDEPPRSVIDFDDAALEPTFQYDDAKGDKHEVWFLDGATVRNAALLGARRGLRGAAVWALGLEEPSVWGALDLTKPASALEQLPAAQQADFIGDGELLRVLRRPQSGARKLEVDPRTGLITDESYQSYPSGWFLERSGAPAKTVALTFDDGPDPAWTPRILDVLKKEGVTATFFMIGRQVADQPDLVRRVYREGHEIGSHSYTHPNMAHVSEDRVRLELAATQRAFEAVLGRSVALFRPPYNADSEPRGYGEIMPVAVAAQEGYVTAGETVDPNDWALTRLGPDGVRRKLTGANVEAEVLANIGKGQSVLLHDGGGDRSATLAALPGLIHTLRAQGYRFSTIGELEGRSRDETMPPIPPAERWLARWDAFSFAIQRTWTAILFWGFTGAIALGLVRIALMIGLAASPTRRRPPPPAETGAPLPRVDALVAAYNEEAVIARTVESLLASRDVALRVIVVDDGSTDATAAVVRARFDADPRVRLASKANGGKASALNVALSLVEAPVVVGVDADTQLEPDALSKLVRWFEDPEVGAVAGNVRVGNAHNLVTRWQSVEYVTSQNVDRRAMSKLNAITVVPGAIGGYRVAALRAIGGYRSDTLAEDMDLTWRLRRAGWRAVNEGSARAYTEAPDTLGGLMRQRFRWTFGTLQCLWKHRGAIGRYGWFGRLALPTLWLFQIAAQILAPFVDLQLLSAFVGRIGAWWDSVQHVDTPMPQDPTLWLVLGIYVAFLALEVAAGWVAYAFDRADKRELWLLPTQRFVYRQLMYIVVWRSLLRALGGAAQGWGKLRRSGAVRMSPAG